MPLKRDMHPDAKHLKTPIFWATESELMKRIKSSLHFNSTHKKFSVIRTKEDPENRFRIEYRPDSEKVYVFKLNRFGVLFFDRSSSRIPSTLPKMVLERLTQSIGDALKRGQVKLHIDPKSGKKLKAKSERRKN
ncbi:MAG TPA: hypothetical protein VFF13_07085 [archaeon]|nr:hypothetical protein [archaeon]